jgi:ketosteroid isomerase-like protein
MTFVGVAVAGLLVSVLLAWRAESAGSTEAAGDSSFPTFLGQFEQGITRFINGDAALWKQHASRRDDVTLMGGWGTCERGWKGVGARYDWAAGRFRDSTATLHVEYMSSGVSGDLAYTVSIERSVVRLADQDVPASMVLRVSHIFRREAGAWTLIHRHADPLVETTAPATVLQA